MRYKISFEVDVLPDTDELIKSLLLSINYLGIESYSNLLVVEAAQQGVQRTPLECAHENATPTLPGFKECHDCGYTVRR